MATLTGPVTVLRDQNTNDGVFGVMLVPGRVRGVAAASFFTMEDDWRFNAAGKSCIPEGDYTLVRTIFHRHNIETFEITGVPGRHRILIHVANTEEDVEGCMGLGLRRERIEVRDEDDPTHPRVMKRAVLESGVAFHRFMEAMMGLDRWPIQIRWAPGLNPEHPKEPVV